MSQRAYIKVLVQLTSWVFRRQPFGDSRRALVLTVASRFTQFAANLSQNMRLLSSRETVCAQ
jgi:hypothetical protein